MDYRYWGYRFLWATFYCFIIATLEGCHPNPTKTASHCPVCAICEDQKPRLLLDALFLEQKDTQLLVCQREKEDAVKDELKCQVELNWYKETYDNPYEENEASPVSYH